MKLKSISSVFVPGSTILLQLILWSSSDVRAAETSPARVATEYALPADGEVADLLLETAGGDLRACSASNRVYIQYCRDPRDGFGTCRLRAGCADNAAAEAECVRDFRAVCGYVPELWFLE